MAPATASDVARYILTICKANGVLLDNLKLQKILYIVGKEYRERTGDVLYQEPCEMWHYGAVIPSVYRKYSWHVASKIRTFDPMRSIDCLSNEYDYMIIKLSEMPAGRLIELARA